MRLGQVIEILGGRALNEFNHAREVRYGFETALLNDVLAHAKPHTTLILTEITNPQVVRTAEMVDAAGVVFVKNKTPDADTIYEAEMNLIIHADHGGQITAEVDASQVVLTAVDDGPGIADVRRALEEPGYSTVPPEIRQMGFGGGMGLNIRKCADQMRLESEPGRGTRLEMTIRLHGPSNKGEGT